MFSATKTGDKQAPYVVELVADSDDDIADLPTYYAPGSTCIVVSSSSVYILNNDNEWKML